MSNKISLQELSAIAESGDNNIDHEGLLNEWTGDHGWFIGPWGGIALIIDEVLRLKERIELLEEKIDG